MFFLLVEPECAPRAAGCGQLCHPLGQPVGSVESGKDFCPESLCLAHCFNNQHVLHSDQGRTCPGLHRKQTISSGRNSPFCWHLSLRCTEELWFSGKHLGPENISLNPSMSRLAKSFSDRVSSPSSFHFPSNPVPPNSSHL